MEAAEGDRIIVQPGEELVVDTGHGRGQAVPALGWRLLQHAVSWSSYMLSTL